MTAVCPTTQKVIPVRRISAALGTLALLATLAACGDKSADTASPADQGDASDTSGLAALTVAGDFGKAPEVTWNEKVTTGTLATKTLIEGEGDVVETGDTAKLDIWIGNGYTKQLAYSTWDKDTGATEPRGAQSVELTDAVSKAILEGVIDHKVGSRVLVVAPPVDAFGDQGNPQLGIGNADVVVFIIDIVSRVEVLDGPQGDPQTPPAGTPKLVESDGTPTGFDFTGLPEQAPTKFSTALLIKGDGAVVEKNQTVTVNYLGVIWGGTTPFDQSFGRGPLVKPIGAGQLIKGWDQGLVGKTVGSRVILTIPPGMAYGEAGQGESIPPNSTLVFVVDILSAS